MIAKDNSVMAKTVQKSVKLLEECTVDGVFTAENISQCRRACLHTLRF